MKKLLVILLLWFVSCSPNNNSKSKNIHAEKLIINQDTFQQKKVKREGIKPETDVNSQAKSVKIDGVPFKNILKSWLNYYHLKPKNFKQINTHDLPNVVTKVDTFDLQNDIYLPFYKFSPDKQKILDITSYNIILEKDKKGNLISLGSDIDSKASVKNLETKTIQRVLFVGSDEIIEDGFWIDNQHLFIVGQLIDDASQFKPIIWFADLQNKTVQVYYYNKFFDKKKVDYLEKIKYKNIK